MQDGYETARQRAARIEGLKTSHADGKSPRTGSEIAAEMIRQAQDVTAAILHWRRTVDRTGQRRVTLELEGEACTTWLPDTMTPAQDAALYAEFWTDWNRQAAENARRAREWRAEMARLNAPTPAVDEAQNEARHTARALLIAPLVVVFGVLLVSVFAAGYCWGCVAGQGG